MTKEGGHVKVNLIRWAPASICLVGECAGRCSRAEEVHAPLGTLRPALIYVKESQRDLDLRHPFFLACFQGSAGNDLVISQVGNVEPVKSRTGRADLGGVINECAECHIIGSNLEFQVGLRVIGASILNQEWLIIISISLSA